MVENGSDGNDGDGYVKRSNGAGSVRKREDYLPWEEYFMAIAFLSAQRSKDPHSQVRLHFIILH